MIIRRETDGVARRRLLLLAVLLTACESGAGKTAYVGATLWNGTGAPPILDAVIIVGGGRIDRVGPPDAVRIPRGAAVVRLDGKWIIPGLIDAHAHTERWMLARFLAYGVTSVRDMGGRQDSIVALRDETSLGSIPSPRLFIAGAMIGASPTTADEARRAIDDRALLDATLVAAGTDTPGPLLAPGASLHQELALLVAAGFTPREALLAATRDAARLIGVDTIGVVEDGTVADFVVLAANPLDDITNTQKIEAVVSRGVIRRGGELRALWQ